MTTPTPISPKVTAGSASGSVVLLLVWALTARGVTVPPEVASALTIIVGAAAGWATPDHLRSLGARYNQRIEEDNHPIGRHADDGDPTNGSPDLEYVPAEQATSDTKADAAH